MTIAEIAERFPIGEQICTVYANRKHEILLVMTHNLLHDSYTLYSVGDVEISRVGSGGNPIALEERCSVENIIGS